MRHQLGLASPARALALLAALGASLSAQGETPLDRYLKRMERELPAPKPELQAEETGKNDVRQRTWSFVSQTWQGKEWKHRLVLVEPKTIERPGTCLILVASGSIPVHRIALVARVAERTKSRGAVLLDVPNQPFHLPGDSRARSEDDLLAETLLRAAATGDETLPLLFPMTRAVHAAMDVLRAVVPELKDFVVTGSSKRGWTSYLTGATGGDRVRAIAPAVYDNLRVAAQMALQTEAFGTHSQMLHDYLVRELMAKLDTEEGRRLATWIDPWTYRERLTLPKLLLLGTNDPYWAPQAASLYARELPGPTLIHYEPNRGHDMWRDDGAVEALAVFYSAVVDGKELPAPVGAETPGAELWEATAPTRDFRKAEWARVESPSSSDGEGNGQASRKTVRAWRARVTIAGAGDLWLWSPIAEAPGK